MKSIIHYDVDENLWPNPQDTSAVRDTLVYIYCRPTVVLSSFFVVLYKVFLKPCCELIISSLIINVLLMIPVSVLFSLVYYNDV